MGRLVWITALGLVFVACKDTGGSDGGDESGDTTGNDGGDDFSTSLTTTTSSTTNTTTSDCVPGSEDCECLDGECIGEFSCIDDVCKPGPLFDPQDDEPMVLAGLVVPITVDVNADEFSWSQVEGPPTEIIGEGPSILVPVPPDAQVGDVITLRINATRNTIQASFDFHITVIDAVFEDFLAGITDTEQLGSSEGIDFDGNGNMWVVSTEGFISRFGVDASFQSRLDVPGMPVGIRFGQIYDAATEDNIDVLFIANAMNESIDVYNPTNEQLSTFADMVEGGGTLGAMNFVLPDGNGNVVASNRTDGQIFRYDANDGVVRLLIDMTGQNPNALSWGPDANVLYVGTIGQVVRVPILPDGTAGDPAVYLDFADPTTGFEVDGIAFDAGGNMYVGVPNSSTLYIARFVGDGATESVREFSEVGTTDSKFTGLCFGNGGFGDTMVYWTNLSDRTVGRLETGLQRL